MVVDMFGEKRSQMQNWMWQRRFDRKYGTRAGLMGDGGKIHILLGLASGGADHLIRLLSRPGHQVRIYNALLAKFRPELVLSQRGDPLAIPYQRTLERAHPIFRIYRLLEEGNNEWILKGMSNRLPPEEINNAPCLIKETRALLATESLLEGLKARMMLFVGDPVRNIDRLFDQHGLEVPYLQSEARSVLSAQFLARFMRRDYDGVLKCAKTIRRITDEREKAIKHRVLIAALIQHMFRRLSLRYPQQVVLAEYDQLEQDPQVLMNMLEHLMGPQGTTLARRTLENEAFVPTGIQQMKWRNAWPDSKTAYGFLTEEEADGCYDMLRDAGLGVGGRELSKEEPIASEQMLEDIYAKFMDASNS
jgi:hypothetical protein